MYSGTSLYIVSQSIFALYYLHVQSDNNKYKIRKISNISGTKNLNDSRLGLQLSLPNLLKPGVK